MNNVTFGSNIYCGPSVLSVLTGKSTDFTAQVLSRVMGKSNITKVSVPALLQSIDLLGFKSEPIETLSDASLFATFHSIYNKDGLYMIILPKHVIAAEVISEKVQVCDNHTKEPMNAAAFARLGQRCVQVFKVETKPVILEVSSRIVTTLTGLELKVERVTLWSDGKENVSCRYMTYFNGPDEVASFIVQVSALNRL